MALTWLGVRVFFNRFMDSTTVFVSVLFVNVAALFLTDFFCSVDGPAHLYNANVLLDLISGNSKLSAFYEINTIPIPNWVSHFLLLTFRFVAPAWLAEKMLLIVYLGGLAISFRLLIKELAPNNISFSFLVFPFSYSFLFYLGFYNYSLSFIFFFLSLWVYFKYSRSKIFQFYVLLGLLIALTYFSNVLLFVFLGFTLGCYSVYETFYEQGKTNSINWKHAILKLGMLLLISIPSLFCFYLFCSSVTFFATGESLSFKELVKWIIDLRPLIIYSYEEDALYTRIMGYILMLLMTVIVYKRYISRTFGLKKTDVILLPLLLAILLFFVVPDSSGAGMMSIRYAILSCMLFIIWLSTQFVSVLTRALIMLTLFLSTVLLVNHVSVLHKLNKDAVEVYSASNYIQEGSVVLPVNLSEDWMQIHFSNYLGIDKPMVILENYEALVGWFPVKWNANRPNFLLNGKEEIEGVQWITNRESNVKREIDYVFIYGNLNHYQDVKWKGLTMVIHQNFKLVHESKNVFVFERINL